MPEYRKKCQVCGRDFTALRSDAVNCGNTCNQRFRRRSLKRLKYAPDQQTILEGAALLQKLKSILPKTAESIEAYIQEHEAAQTGILVRLALTAHIEGKARRNHEE